MPRNKKIEPPPPVFYQKILKLLQESPASYLLGGAFAVFHYTGIYRDTKDLDIFCRAEEYPLLLKYFKALGFRTELTDSRWLCKVFEGEYFIDIIFNTPNNICRVDKSWFDTQINAEVLGVMTRIVPPEELIWCKAYVQNRYRYDGADIIHILLKYGTRIDWNHLQDRFQLHWQLLLAFLIQFQFIYPTDFKRIIPQKIFTALLDRAHDHLQLPASERAICLGPLIDQEQYRIDIDQWQYKVTIM